MPNTTLASGREVAFHGVSPMELVLSGLCPNVILEVVAFEVWGKPTDTYAERVKTMFEAQLMVVARGLDTPKLVLGPVENLLDIEPNVEKGEIGPKDVTPREVIELYGYIIGETVPARAAAPFSAPQPDAGGTGETLDALPADAAE